MIHLMLWALLCQEMVKTVDINTDTKLMMEVNQNAPTPEIEQILDEGASPNAKTQDHVSPLMVSAFLGNIETTRLLGERGANMNATDAKGNAPLIYAVAQNRPESNAQVIAYLLSKGAKPNMAANNGDTPLLVLTRTPFVIHRAKELEALLDAGADVDAQDTNMRTPLMNLIVLSAQDVDARALTPLIQLVLAKGPDLGLKDKDGWTALMMARKMGHDAWCSAIEAAAK